MVTGSTGRPVADLHKGAFWIYGVTAMVMREPFAGVIRHISAAGPGDWQVRLEVMRVVAVLGLMARLFLASGLYFDRVYMRPDSAARFPRRSYAIDFLAGLLQFLMIVAASTAVALHARFWAGLSIFALLIAIFLLFESFWLALAIWLGFSAGRQIGALAKSSGAMLAAGVLLWGGARAGGADPVLADHILLGLVIGLALFDIAKLVRKYEVSDQ